MMARLTTHVVQRDVEAFHTALGIPIHDHISDPSPRVTRKAAGSPYEQATFRDLERFASKTGRPRPGRAVGGILRAFYLKHPGRVQVVRGRTSTARNTHPRRGHGRS